MVDKKSELLFEKDFFVLLDGGGFNRISIFFVYTKTFRSWIASNYWLIEIIIYLNKPFLPLSVGT